MRCSRLDLLAAIICCIVNDTTTQSFSWRPASRTSPMRPSPFCRCTNSQPAFIHSKSKRPPKRRSIFFGRCVYDNSVAARCRVLFANLSGRDEEITGDLAKARRRNSISTFSTAVCIVPPDDAWDSIQRARHLARDTSFYKWPPAIRLFHPFALKSEIPSYVGKLAEWIDEEGLKFDLSPDDDELPHFLSPFEVTLDSLQILPHWEVLDARIDEVENQISQQAMGETLEEERIRKRKESSQLLIDQEERKGITRKKEREKKQLIDRRRKLKRDLKQSVKEKEMGNDHADIDKIRKKLKEVQNEIDRVQSLNTTSAVDDDDEKEDEGDGKKTNSFSGPCVIYLSPNEKSCSALRALREQLRAKVFPAYDAFSPSSSVSSYPEHLPRKALSDEGMEFRPLLPIARFPSVEAAVQVAKTLQKDWDPLSFNVTDIQFISRTDDDYANNHADFARGTGFGRSGKTSHTTQSVAVTTSGEVEDVSKRGVFGCDAMVMLLGEEPEEELIEDDATLSMIVPEGESESHDVDGGHVDLSSTWQGTKIDYDKLFATAEREYQRMKSHEELSSAVFLGSVPIFSGDDDIEKWLDADDGESDDDGATVVVGRAQFFVGAMREFIGMPVSSVIDQKERIMRGGVNSVARRKGSVHRKSESWDDGDFGKRDKDLLS